MQAKDMTFTDHTHHYTANAGMEMEQYSGECRREGWSKHVPIMKNSANQMWNSGHIS